MSHKVEPIFEEIMWEYSKKRETIYRINVVWRVG